jgi:hypothetical protein
VPQDGRWKAAILFQSLKAWANCRPGKGKTAREPDRPSSVERWLTQRIDDKGCRDQVVGIEAQGASVASHG